MTTVLVRGLVLGAILVLAAWLRLHDLSSRPMHADEANQAVKLGALLERGEYRFDPYDHHGPTLYYLAGGLAVLRGERSLAALTETTVRLTPAVAGVLAVLLLAGVMAPLGWTPALLAALFLAVAPASVYYSRYFVQETLLVTFSLLALLGASHARRTGALGWIVLTGAALGLMQATKATAPVLVVVAALAWIGSRRWQGETEHHEARAPRRLRTAPAIGLTLLTAVGVAALFYSSFGTHPAGLRDALATYLPMTGRVAGAPAGHEKPWWYYGSLFWRQTNGGYVWDQTPFLVLALAGAILALGRGGRGFRAVLLYGVGLATALSVVAYKTPWIVIHLVTPLCVLAAILPAWGAQRAGWWRGLAAVVVAGVVAWQLVQVRQAVFRRPADPRNPFAYVHSAPDVKKASGLLSAAGTGMVRVISEEYWPLPWYLRNGENVGYWTQPPENCDGALLFVSPALVGTVRERLQGRYDESYLGLRPGFLLHVFRRRPETP
ncbi:MAG TPA: TIGR03663 family protein [Opitutaceae bacterium]|nr:TIGR03663 family protein [Opitutaceae bacterium]